MRLMVPRERCAARYIPAHALEDLVWQNLCEVLTTPEIITHTIERARGGHWLLQELQTRQANLRRGRAALNQQLERLTKAYLAAVLPLDEYERRRREVERRLLALDAQEQALRRDTMQHDQISQLAAHAEAFCQRLQNGLVDAEFDRNRALLELLVDRVIVTNGHVEIRYVVPTGPDGARQPFWRLRTDYYGWFAAFRDAGVWEALPLLDAARPRAAGREASPTAAVIDSQSVKSSEAGGPWGYDAGKKVQGRKRHAMVDTDGRPLVLQCHAASVQDRAGAIPLLRASRRHFPFVVRAFADAAYPARHVTGATCIAIEMVRKSKGQVGFTVSPRCWVVERSFAWLGRNRRLLPRRHRQRAARGARVLPERTLFAAVGGFHLSGENEMIIPETVRDLAGFDLPLLVPAHCTGWRAVAELERAFGERVVPAAVGKLFTLKAACSLDRRTESVQNVRIWLVRVEAGRSNIVQKPALSHALGYLVLYHECTPGRGLGSIIRDRTPAAA
jgi:transposase